MDKAGNWRTGAGRARHGGLIGVVLLAVLLGGCSIERAFCGTGSLACQADAEYSRID